MESHPIRRFITAKLGLSSKKVLSLFNEGKVSLNGNVVGASATMFHQDEIIVDGVCIQEKTIFKYLAIYKPAGIECTSNRSIPQNIYEVLPDSYQTLFPVGRLDKASEGLLFFTNDSKFYRLIQSDKSFYPKTYEVKTIEPLRMDDIDTMANGMKILGKQTRKSKIKLLDEYTFQITLTQGLNRQIRRMCYKLNYTIVYLKRTSIGNLTLEDFQFVANDFQCKEINSEMVQQIKDKQLL